jgi:hypothetical protein
MRHLLLLLRTACSLSFAGGPSGKPSGNACHRYSDPHVQALCLADPAEEAEKPVPVKESQQAARGALVQGAKALGAVGAGIGALLLLGGAYLFAVGAPIGGC